MKQGRLAASVVLWLFPMVTIGLVAGLVVGILALTGSMDINPSLLLRWIVAPLVVAIAAGAWAAIRNRPEPQVSMPHEY